MSHINCRCCLATAGWQPAGVKFGSAGCKLSLWQVESWAWGPQTPLDPFEAQSGWYIHEKIFITVCILDPCLFGEHGGVLVPCVWMGRCRLATAGASLSLQPQGFQCTQRRMWMGSWIFSGFKPNLGCACRRCRLYNVLEHFASSALGFPGHVEASYIWLKNVDFALLLQECSTFGGTDCSRRDRPSCCIQVSALGSVVFQTSFRPTVGGLLSYQDLQLERYSPN